MASLKTFVVFCGNSLTNGESFSFPKTILSNNELFIYNRWGDLIYEAAPYNNEWAGQANKGIGGTEKIGDGIFYYVLFTNDGDPIKGSIEMKSK